MADYDLTQTGQEVQDILDGAAMQTDLTAETERAELAEQTLQGGIDAEETRAKAAEKQNADDIDVIESKIPAGASDQNQLADKEFVNNSIATATATYRGAYNLVNDLSLTVGATHEQIATALAGAISTADNNDYCFVQIPTADATPTQIASIERYKFNGTAWAYEYTLNNSGFTAAQWAALNSGITSGLVAKLSALPTNDALTLALAGKQDVLTFDSVPVDGSNNPVKSGGVYSAIGDEETRAKAAEKANADDIDDIEALIPATASDENQLADKEYVNSSISTATATYRGSFNEVNDLSLNTDATHEQIATALAGAISTADNNDYCFVQIPTADATPTQIAAIERYKFNGTAWAYEYTLNNSGFTAAQWAALNSGITSGLVAKLSALPTNDALTLALAGKQDVLTFDNEPTNGSNNPVKSGGVYDAIDVEATTRAAAIAAIVALIPEAASALNQLADKAFVNSSISTATAVFKGTYNVVVDLELSYNATQEQIATMLASKIISADNNDYCFVQIPTSDASPLQIARTDRYKFNGTVWAYEYTLNNSGFTTAQWAAINSGITSLLKDKLIDLPTATELTALLAAKQNQLTFDTTPTTGSTNPVTSGGIKSAIDAEKTRAEAAEADRYTKSETYNKTEINGMVSTPHQNYVTVPTYASLPSSGQSTDTIYRVSSYDGANNQVDDTVYSEYAWDGTQYVFLDVKSQIEEVFDITVYNSNTKYANLSAALGVDGANIPATLRRGGMSVKFVQSSDNKYIRFNLIANEFTTDVTKWAVDDSGVYNSNPEFIYVAKNNKNQILWGIRRNNDFYFGAGCPSQIVEFVLAHKEEILAEVANIAEVVANKVDKIDGKSLIDAIFADAQKSEYSPEYSQATIDSEKRILEGITKDSRKKINIPVDTPSANFESKPNKEWLHAETDKDKKIFSGRNIEGKLIEYVGIETPIVDVKERINLSDTANKQLKSDLGIEGVAARNLDKEPALLAACRYRSISADAHESNPLQKDFQISMITDTHSNTSSILNAIKATNAFRSIDAIIHCGDIEIFSPRENSNNYVGKVVDLFNSNLQSKPWFMVCGNHDVGVTRYIHFIRTHEEVYNDFVKPLIDNGTLKNGEYNTLPANPSDEDYKDSCYYFHDFDDRQVRLIVLYEYAWDLVLEDENPYWEPVPYNSSYPMMQKNTTYTYDANNPIILNCGGWKANSFRLKQTVTTVNDATDDRTGKTFPCVKSRSCQFFNIEQINWLANVLNSTPNGYGIVIATHIPAPSAFGTLMTDKNFCMRGYDFNGGSVDVNSNVPVLLGIVNAWINKTSISERVKFSNNAYCARNGFDVEYENVLGSGDDTYAYEISLDFSSRSNNNCYFGGYLGGHVHYDLVVKGTDYPDQICIVECCGFPQYRGGADLPNIEDSNNLAFDDITVFSCNKNRIALARIGNTKTTDGRTRDFEVININQ